MIELHACIAIVSALGWIVALKELQWVHAVLWWIIWSVNLVAIKYW
jgi:hypothetical protein